MKRFPWVFSVLWLFILIVMVSAGFWQINRADEKQQIKERMDAGLIHKPETWSDWQQLQAFDPVEVNGQYGHTHFLLDNQISEGQVGYFLYTAFQTTDGVWLLINRGWTDNSEQNFAVTQSRQNIKALVADWPRPGVQLGEQTVNNQEIQHVTYMEQQPIIELLKQRHCQQSAVENCIILPQVLKLDAKMDDGFLRQWQLPRMTVAKHRAYATQWFTMSLVLCFIYVLFVYKNYYASKN